MRKILPVLFILALIIIGCALDSQPTEEMSRIRPIQPSYIFGMHTMTRADYEAEVATWRGSANPWPFIDDAVDLCHSGTGPSRRVTVRRHGKSFYFAGGHHPPVTQIGYPSDIMDYESARTAAAEIMNREHSGPGLREYANPQCPVR